MNNTKLPQENLVKIPVTTVEYDSILKYIEKYLKVAQQKHKIRSVSTSKPLVIFTPNPEQAVYAYRYPWFGELMKKADVTIPDGVGLVLAAKILGVGRIRRRIPGIEMAEALAALAEKQRVRIGLIGGTDGLAERAYKCLWKSYPTLVGWGKDVLQMHVDEDEITEDASRLRSVTTGRHRQSLDRYMTGIANSVIRSKTRVVLIGLGAPKQELFALDLASLLSARGYGPVVIMVVGGAFDVWAGDVSRSPRILRAVGGEWMWRLMMQPWRWRRQLALFTFLQIVWNEKRSRA